MLLSVVIPCYNESEVIDHTHTVMVGLLDGWKREAIFADYELIYVNDGSQDSTKQKLYAIADTCSNVRVLSFSSNFGHQAALLAGMSHAVGDAVVTMDADLQDPPQVIAEMVEHFQAGSQIVYGVRKSRSGDTHFKRLTAKFFYRMMRWMQVDIVYNHADFRLISRRVIFELSRYKEVNLFLRGLFPKIGFKHSIVNYDREDRHAGETKYPFHKMLNFALDGITSFSQFPLRLVFFAGVLVFVISMILAGWVLATWAWGKTVPGWSSTMLPLSILSGLQMLFMGLIGEYVGKIYLEVKARPPFIIEDIYSSSDNSQMNEG